jgi:hypothetical protein
MPSLRRAALWYALRLGWYVLPLRDREKIPRIADWEELASRDAVQIERWWRRWPAANVGVAAGKSGLLVFDIDAYKDSFAGGELLAAEDEQTITNLTGGGGSHLVFQMPEDALYGNGTGALPPGIDIRGWGGQFVAPPSVHPSGRLYQWEVGYGPHEREARPAPEGLRRLLEAQREMQLPPITFGEAEGGPPELGRWPLSKRVCELIHAGAEMGQRSESDQKVITALVAAGATNEEIRAIFEYYPIGREGKFREKGRHGLHYLALSIAHARVWTEQKRQQEIDQRATAFLQRAARACG